MDVFRQRIRQFREAGHVPTPADYALARDILGEGPLFDLFAEQTPRDILHSVNTARWLLERNHHDPGLLAAALLHDIGKGRQRTRDRVAWVVAQELRIATLAPNGRSRLELRRALQRSRDHTAIGASLLEAAGAPADVVELTLLHHGDAGANAMLRVLQEADAAS
jgi:putative nucleotidyltransferase with HDIG domain